MHDGPWPRNSGRSDFARVSVCPIRKWRATLPLSLSKQFRLSLGSRGTLSKTSKILKSRAEMKAATHVVAGKHDGTASE